ncbi:hypothetical protein CR513_52566, partial [Mucuna pruriens]
MADMYPPYTYKTAFMKNGLKNIGATYQRLMDIVFVDHTGRNLEVYMDNMVVKSTSLEEHIKDLEEIFAQQDASRGKVRILDDRKTRPCSNHCDLTAMPLLPLSYDDNSNRPPYPTGVAKTQVGWKDGSLFEPRGAIKTQALANFLVEMTSPPSKDPYRSYTWMALQIRREETYHCSPKSSTGETPYQLTFGIGTMILVEIGEPLLRRSSFNLAENLSSLRTDLNLV